MRPTLTYTIALSAMLAVSAIAQTARGTSFTVHIKITAVGDGPMATSMRAQQAEWRGTATSVATRGRIDIVEGGQPPVLQQGSFMLFEGANAVAVNPDDKSFLLMQGAQLLGMSALSGLQITLKNVVVKLDTLGPGESIEGRPTQHYRVTSSYEMTMAMAGGTPIATTQTSDFWIATTTDVPVTPFSRTTASSVRGTGPMAELIDKIAAAMAGLPQGGAPLRSVVASRVTMAGMAAGTDNITEISDIKAADVDLDRLVLPSGFVERTLPGMPPADSTSSAAAERWRTRPKP
jgi:hypothetical protein